MDGCFFVDDNAHGKTPHESVGTPDDRLDLLAGSPCVDAGDNKQVPPDVADLDGDRDTLERMPLDIASRPGAVCPRSGGRGKYVFSTIDTGIRGLVEWDIDCSTVTALPDNDYDMPSHHLHGNSLPIRTCPKARRGIESFLSPARKIAPDCSIRV